MRQHVVCTAQRFGTFHNHPSMNTCEVVPIATYMAVEHYRCWNMKMLSFAIEKVHLIYTGMLGEQHHQLVARRTHDANLMRNPTYVLLPESTRDSRLTRLERPKHEAHQDSSNMHLNQ